MVRIGINALRAWSKNRKMMMLTTTISSTSVWRSVSIEARIRPDRS